MAWKKPIQARKPQKPIKPQRLIFTERVGGISLQSLQEYATKYKISPTDLVIYLEREGPDDLGSICFNRPETDEEFCERYGKYKEQLKIYNKWHKSEDGVALLEDELEEIESSIKKLESSKQREQQRAQKIIKKIAQLTPKPPVKEPECSRCNDSGKRRDGCETTVCECQRE